MRRHCAAYKHFLQAAPSSFGEGVQISFYNIAVKFISAVFQKNFCFFFLIIAYNHKVALLVKLVGYSVIAEYVIHHSHIRGCDFLGENAFLKPISGKNPALE